MKKAAELGAKVTYMSGPDGYVHDPDGINTEEKLNFILEMRAKDPMHCKPYADRFGCEFVAGAKHWGAKDVDVNMPSAMQNDVRMDSAEKIAASGVKYYIEVANMPTTNDALRYLMDCGLIVAPSKAVNAGGSTDRWENASGEVVLLNDIDLTELTEWTPIGQGKATGSPSYNTLTNPFTGVFDGQGFTIKGIRWTFNVENETTHLHGLFGAIKDATIKNLKLGAAGDQITLAGTSQNVVSAGALAGYAEGSTIVNVTNNVSVILTGDNPDATLMMLAGIAGCIKSTTIGGETKDDAVINNGDVKTGRITNTANGGTGMNIGGICAFTLGAGTKLNYCTNNGEISAPTGRGGGLVGTLGGSTTEENGTVIANSTNNGTIQDDAIGQYGGSKDYYNNKRMGGLVGGTVTTNTLRIEYSTNNGNVFSQLGCRTGGFVGHNQATIVGCVNKGTILANITYASGEPQHGPGWACGYSGKKLVTQCAKGGRVGEWDTYKDNPGSAPEATNDNALCYKNGDYFDPSQNY